MRSLGSSSSSSSADLPAPDLTDSVSQAVLSFMYESGLLIVAQDQSVMAIVRDSPLAQCHEVLAYDEPEENQSAVEALDSLQSNGVADCTCDQLGRKIFQVSFKGQDAVQKSGE